VFKTCRNQGIPRISTKGVDTTLRIHSEQGDNRVTLPNRTITVRPARHDDVSAILAWVNAPALLAATRVERFSESQMTDARNLVRTFVDQQNCLIAVCDNIRVAAILHQSTALHEDGACPIWYIPRLQFETITRYDEILDEARKLPLPNWNTGRFLPDVAALVSETVKPAEGQVTKFEVEGRRVLVLGPAERSRVPIVALEERGYEVSLGSHHDEIYANGPYDLVVCSGYHLRIPPTICDEFSGRIINIHAGCLPWARGIGPTLFSTMLDYPLGTSIHLIDSGLDTGDLLLEDRMDVRPNDTLRTLYARLLEDVNQLFVKFLDLLVSNRATRAPQRQVGPRAYSRNRTEFETVLEVCPNGYDTELEYIKRLATAMKGILAFRSLLTFSTSTGNIHADGNSYQ